MVVPLGLSSTWERIVVRDLAHEDSPGIGKILAESPEAALWPADSLREAASCGMRAWVAEQGGEMSGFLVGRQAADEFEILNLAVVQAHRRRGTASRLLDTALRWARGAGSKRVLLEVRATNQAAIGLYSRHGFTVCGRRTQYYQNPAEDALLFARTLNEEF
jgi:[ribosomal protein S18]-alanine N-acetyltransferase